MRRRGSLRAGAKIQRPFTFVYLRLRGAARTIGMGGNYECEAMRNALPRSSSESRKKKEKKDKMEEAVLKREIQVLNGRIITPDIEQNKIQIEVRIGKRIKYNIRIADDRYSTSRVIECIKIKINELFDVIAHSKEKEMGSNLIEEIDELLKNSNVSESEKEFMTVKVQKEQTEVDRKIIFKTIRRQHLRTDTVKVQNSKEELEYYIHDKLWIYTNKKVILKGGEDTSTYEASFAEDEIENLEKNIRRAKELVEEIKTWE